MKNFKIDLHLHSTASDGRYTPDMLVDLAEANSIKVMSLTDHDTIENNDIMHKLCSEREIKFIPGIELSTRMNGESIHILGYYPHNNDIENVEYKKYLEFKSALEEFKVKRDKRAMEIIRRLKEIYNIELSFESLREISDGNIGRPHIARLINEKYGYDHEYIFKNFIGDDSKAYVPSSNMTVEDGLELLDRFNCVKILAHPGEYRKNNISAVLDKGNFDGIEAFYSTHTVEETSYYLGLAKERNLFVTCGSDFHGIENDTIHGSLGSTNFVYDKLEPFLRKFSSSII